MALDISEIRRLNLELLTQKRGSAAALAKKIDSSPSYLSQVKIKDKNLGDDVARRIETALGLERGYMDVLHTIQETPTEEVGANTVRDQRHHYAVHAIPSTQAVPAPLKGIFEEITNAWLGGSLNEKSLQGLSQFIKSLPQRQKDAKPDKGESAVSKLTEALSKGQTH